MNEHLENIKAIAQELHEILPICYLQAIQHRLEQIVKEADAALLKNEAACKMLEKL
jgi:hypothetical protein